MDNGSLTEKACSQCGEVKPLSEFYKRGKPHNSFRADCKTCFKEYSRKRPRFDYGPQRKSLHTEEWYETVLADPTKAKRCPACGEEKALTEFYRAVRQPDGFDFSCKSCKRIYHQKRYAENPQVHHARHIGKTYAITADEYAAILKSQGGVCAICDSPPGDGKRQMAVDHNHTTGAVRGILCVNCNAGIGHLKDDPALLAKAIDYLLRF